MSIWIKGEDFFFSLFGHQLKSKVIYNSCDGDDADELMLVLMVMVVVVCVSGTV